MKPRAYIGIDNGVTGSIGIITPTTTDFFSTPTVTRKKYTKAPAKLRRIDFPRLVTHLQEYTTRYDCVVALENPYTNKSRINATILAARSHESTLIALEYLGILEHNGNLKYTTSKEWQKKFLPRVVKGDGLKVASRTLGCCHWPQHCRAIQSQKDADGLFLAAYVMMETNG